MSLFGRRKILFESDYAACSHPRLHGDYTFSEKEEWQEPQVGRIGGYTDSGFVSTEWE